MKIPLYFSHNHRHRYTAFRPLENLDLVQVGLVDLRLWDSASFQGWVHVQIYYATLSWSQLLDQDYKKRPSMTDLSSLGLTRVEKQSLHNGSDLRLLIAIFLDSRENDSTILGDMEQRNSDTEFFNLAMQEIGPSLPFSVK